MRITITGTQLEITPALNIYVLKRLESLANHIKPFEKSGEMLLRAEIARSTKHHKKGEEVYYVEFTIALPKKTIRIEQYNANVRKAVDEAQRRIKSAISDYKDLLVEKKKKTTERIYV